jgi:hypothetical protein
MFPAWRKVHALRSEAFELSFGYRSEMRIYITELNGHLNSVTEQANANRPSETMIATPSKAGNTSAHVAASSAEVPARPNKMDPKTLNRELNTLHLMHRVWHLFEIFFLYDENEPHVACTAFGMIEGWALTNFPLPEDTLERISAAVKGQNAQSPLNDIWLHVTRLVMYGRTAEAAGALRECAGFSPLMPSLLVRRRANHHC